MNYLGINTGNVLFALKGRNVWQRHTKMDNPVADCNHVDITACTCCMPAAIEAFLDNAGIDFRKNDKTNPPTEEEWQNILRQHIESPMVFKP